MKSILNTLLIGSTGVGASELVPIIPQVAQVELGSIAQVVMQIVIGIVTLLGLLKKRK
jgi:predicted AAA+ superfamily ATPase